MAEVEVPEGMSRVSNLDPVTLARIVGMLPEKLSIQEAAEIFVNILKTYDMENDLIPVCGLAHYILKEGHVQTVEIETLDMKKGTN